MLLTLFCWWNFRVLQLYLWWWFWWQWPGASAARTAGNYQPSRRKCRCRSCNFVFELLWQIHLHVWASCKSCNFSITGCRPTQVLHSQYINLLMKQYLQTTNNRWSLQMDHCYLLKKTCSYRNQQIFRGTEQMTCYALNV
jgi:hypothetical protein